MIIPGDDLGKHKLRKVAVVPTKNVRNKQEAIIVNTCSPSKSISGSTALKKKLRDESMFNNVTILHNAVESEIVVPD